jgi:DNA invertase Pin-like site-specific DNA recombinase
MSEPIRAVLYAAKSTEDKHGSIKTQIEDCRVLAERQGWEVVGQESDEAFSAYSGNRGPGLERAKALAADTASEHGRCVLVAQDADRFARGSGDAPGAADHLGEVYFAMRRQGVSLWTERSGELDPIRAALEGERSNDESARKTQSIKAGLKRRKDAGKPVGPMPLGYDVEKTVVDGNVVTKRVVDPVTVTVVERIFSAVERGASFGDVSRTLNAEGITGRRGTTFSSRTIRTIVHNPAYKGEKGYPMIIEPERYDAILAGLARLDPAAVQKRQGGRKPRDESYILRGIVFCRSCGASLWTRPQAAGRMYVCAHRRRSTGLCNAEPIPAELIEGHVLNHLDAFVGSMEGWIAEQVRERTAEQEARAAAVERQRAALEALDRQREKLLAEYRRMVAEGDRLAPYALEAIEPVNQQRRRRCARAGWRSRRRSRAAASAERAGVWNFPRQRPQTPRLALLAERCVRRNSRTRRKGLPPYTYTIAQPPRNWASATSGPPRRRT